MLFAHNAGASGSSDAGGSRKDIGDDVLVPVASASAISRSASFLPVKGQRDILFLVCALRRVLAAL